MKRTFDQSSQRPGLYFYVPLSFVFKALGIVVGLAMTLLPNSCSGQTAKACASAALDHHAAVCR